MKIDIKDIMKDEGFEIIKIDEFDDGYPHLYAKNGTIITIQDMNFVNANLQIRVNIQTTTGDSIQKVISCISHLDTGMIKVENIVANEDYTLTISFSDKSVKLFDMNKIVTTGLFKALQDLERFMKVHIAENGNSIRWDKDPNVDSNMIWRNHIDLCADTIYEDSIMIQKDAKSI